MFGDCAHGAVMFGFALWMVVKENQFLKTKGSNEASIIVMVIVKDDNTNVMSYQSVQPDRFKTKRYLCEFYKRTPHLSSVIVCYDFTV